MIETSEAINELAAALAKAQGEMTGAVKDSANPFFKSRYADLASVWDACRKPLTAHGLSIVQSPTAEGGRVSVQTVLLHTSGQWMRDVVSAAAKDESPQSVGSCITYLRRYALQSFAGVAPEDDDAEAAQGRAVVKPSAARLAGQSYFHVPHDVDPDTGEDVGPSQYPQDDELPPPPYPTSERAGERAPQPTSTSDVISDKQAKRFYAMARNAGWKDTELKNWLKNQIGTEDDRQIPKRKYDALCSAVSAGVL